jgi:copper homeostasis protein
MAHERSMVTHPSAARTLVEACVQTPAEAVAAEAAGAGRVELCASLVEGGITPSAGLMSAVVERVNVPVAAILRPRGGDFIYEAEEVDVMLRDIEVTKEAGVEAIVTGALTPAGAIDIELMQRLIEASDPLPVVFHRAFDLTPDLLASVELLLELGVTRVLTSGGAQRALDGVDMLSRLAERAGDAMTIMAGGGVRADHVAELVAASGVREVHARPTMRVPSRMTRSNGLSFGADGPAADAGHLELDARGIRDLVRALEG